MPRDGLVLLEVAAGDPRAVADALSHARFVTADGDTPARVVQLVENGRVQALLAPARALAAGMRAHLALGVADLDAALAREPFDIGDALGAPDVPLAWSAAPEVVRAVEVASNKGDGTHAELVRTAVTEPGWVVATIAAAGKTSRAIYRIADGTALIGTVGCHTAYFVDRAGDRLVTLTAIDAFGRSADAPSSVTLHFR